MPAKTIAININVKLKDLEKINAELISDMLDLQAEIKVFYGLNVGLEARNEMLSKELALSKHQHNNALIEIRELNKRVR